MNLGQPHNRKRLAAGSVIPKARVSMVTRCLPGFLGVLVHGPRRQAVGKPEQVCRGPHGRAKASSQQPGTYLQPCR